MSWQMHRRLALFCWCWPPPVRDAAARLSRVGRGEDDEWEEEEEEEEHEDERRRMEGLGCVELLPEEAMVVGKRVSFMVDLALVGFSFFSSGEACK